VGAAGQSKAATCLVVPRAVEALLGNRLVQPVWPPSAIQASQTKSPGSYRRIKPVALRRRRSRGEDRPRYGPSTERVLGLSYAVVLGRLAAAARLNGDDAVPLGPVLLERIAERLEQPHCESVGSGALANRAPQRPVRLAFQQASHLAVPCGSAGRADFTPRCRHGAPNVQEQDMADDKTEAGGQDRSRINVHEDYELRSWAADCRWAGTRIPR